MAKKNRNLHLTKSTWYSPFQSFEFDIWKLSEWFRRRSNQIRMLIKRLGCCLYGRSLRYFFHQFTNHIKLNICLKFSSSASVLRDSTSECIQISWGILLQYSISCGCHSFLHFHIFCIHLPWHNYSFQTKEHHTQDWYGTFVIIEVNGLVLISITFETSSISRE